MKDRLQKQSPRDKIIRWGKEAGFDLIGIAATQDAALTRVGHQLQEYLAAHHHGTMAWMERQERQHPRRLWENAKSAILLAAHYTPQHDPLAWLQQKETATISAYALGDDYHHVVGKQTKWLAQKITAHFKGEVKTFIDTAPIMEKPLAALAGIGWQGKHTNLVSRRLGGWFFLSVILTDLDLPPDAAGEDHCGSCQKCLDICPTNAFPAPYQLDARRCISYLTIEHKGHIPRELRAAIGNRIYGCDDCLAVCPWNKFARSANSMMAFNMRDELRQPPLRNLLQLDEESFRKFFRRSPIKRIGYERWQRNLLIAIGNSGDPDFLGDIRLHLDNAAALARGAAIWAFAQLATHDEFLKEKKLRADKESDAAVKMEWDYIV